MATSRIPLLMRPLVAGVFALAGCWAPTAGLTPAIAPAPATAVALPQDPNAPKPPLPRPAPWAGAVPAALSGAGRLDWTMDRFSGPAVVAARKAASQGRAQDPAFRKLMAFGDNTGWAGGIALTDPAFGVTGVASSGPAYAYRGSAKMQFRVWFVTSTGWLLGVKVGDPKNAAANPDNVPIKINLGRPVTAGYVTLSDDGERAYVVSDNGRMIMADLDPGSVVADLPIDPSSPTGASLGMAAFMDPLLTNPNSGVQDVLFTANNAGKVAKFTWNGTSFAAAGLQTGVNITAATDGSTTSLLKATPVALGGVLYYGDRGGNLNVMDFDAGYSASNPATTFLGSAWPVETPVALDLDNALSPNHVFAAVGPESAWVDITNPAAPVVSTSPVLAIDSATGSAPASSAGVVSGFPYQGISITSGSAAALTNPVQAASALTPTSGSGTGMTLMNGDVVATFLQSYRTASLGGSQIIDQNLPTCQTVYGTTNTSGNTTNYSYAHQAQPAASRTRFSTPIDVAFGPYGEAYIGGKTNNNNVMVKMVASQAMAPAWGYSAATLSANQAGVNTFMGNRTYIVAGTGSPVNTAGFNEPHAVFYDNNNTTGTDADDSIWVADWAGSRVRRVMRATGVVSNIAGFSGAYPNGSLNGPHGICRAWGATGAPVFFTQYSNRNIVKYDLATNTNTLVNFNYGGTLTTTLPGVENTNLCYLNGPNDGAQGSLYIPSRGSHVVQRYDIATNVLTIHCGTLGSAAGSPSADGTLRASALLNGPEAVTGNPLNSDLYIGENTGKRVKVIYGSGASAGRLYTLAGNGGSTYSGDGLAGPSVSLGWVSGLRLGPPDLTAPATNPYSALYMDSRDTHTIIRFDFPDATAAYVKGLMRWDYSSYVNRNFIRANVDLTVHTAVPATTGGNPTTVPRPDLVLASKVHPSGVLPWTTLGLTPATVPSHNPNIKAIYPAASATTPQSFAVDATMTYKLPAGSLPNDGQLSLALVPPAGNGYTYHYGWGQNVAWTPADRETVDVHGIASTSAAAKRPRLTGILSSYKFQNPILSPPSVYNDGSVKYVFVANANAIFRLNFSSVNNWTGDAAYTATRIGRTTNGPIDTTVTAPYHFIANPTPPSLTYNGKVFMMDRKLLAAGGNYNFTLNKFDGLGATSPTYVTPPANCQIDNQAVSSGLTTGTYFCMDVFDGSDTGFAYFGLGNGKIYRLGQ